MKTRMTKWVALAAALLVGVFGVFPVLAAAEADDPKVGFTLDEGYDYADDMVIVTIKKRTANWTRPILRQIFPAWRSPISGI